jgi:hypothetical protein
MFYAGLKAGGVVQVNGRKTFLLNCNEHKALQKATPPNSDVDILQRPKFGENCLNNSRYDSPLLEIIPAGGGGQNHRRLHFFRRPLSR